jgi:hypothetical protein
VSAGAKLREENGGIDPLLPLQGKPYPFLDATGVGLYARNTTRVPSRPASSALHVASHETFFLSHFSASISITTHKTF